MNPELLEKLTCFIQAYLPYTDRNLVKNYLSKHYKFHTIDFALDENQEVIGLVRWNISDDGETGFILDLAIRPDWRNKGLGNHFIARALKSFPKAKWLVFKRGRKLRNEERKIAVSEFLKHNKF
jgi:Acetyltransferase (GNAT) family.